MFCTIAYCSLLSNRIVLLSLAAPVSEGLDFHWEICIQMLRVRWYRPFLLQSHTWKNDTPTPNLLSYLEFTGL